MGNFQDHFENIKDDASQYSQKHRIENTIITHQHHSLAITKNQANIQPISPSRVVDHQLIHSTLIHRENHFEKEIKINYEHEDEKEESVINDRLQELDFEFYHRLALLDYEFKEIPNEYKREFTNLETVEQKDHHGIKYIGEWKDNLLHGNGVLISNTSKYIGQFRFGLKHFHGREIFKHQVYQGTFEADRRKGQGVRYTEQSTQIGIFDGHLIYGLIKYINGNQYKGSLKNNKYHGKGIATSIQQFNNIFNDTYLKESYKKWAPQYQDDKGNLFYQAESDTWYEHSVYNLGTIEHAKIIYSNGNIYQGQIQKGCKHGKGKFVWKDGSVYQGDYQWDQKHGKGTLITRGKEYRNKQFINGTMKQEMQSFIDDQNSQMPSQWL